MKSPAATLLRWLAPHRGAVLASVLLGSLASGLEVASIGLVAPLLLAEETGLGRALGPLAAIAAWVEPFPAGTRRLLLVATILVGMTLRGLAWWGAAALREGVAAAVHGECRRRIFERLSTAPLAWFRSKTVGEHQALLLHESERVATAARYAVQLTVAAVMALTFAALLFALAPLLTLAATSLLVAFGLLLRWLRRPIERYADRMRTEAQGVQGALHETLSGLHLLRLLGRTDDALARFEGPNRRFLDAHRRQRRAFEAVLPVSELAGAVALVGILWLGSTTLGGEGPARAAFLLPYAFLFYRLLPRYLAVVGARAALAATLGAVPVVDAFLRGAETEPLPDGDVEPPPGTPRVVFEGVRFRYAPDTPWVLDGLDLVLEPGRSTALVGASGSGKSTVVDLLLGLRRPTEGRITVDGVDLAALRGDAWRRRVGVVPQDPMLFDRSVRENLRLAAPQATDDEIAASLDVAAATSFVRDLPRGLDTVLGDRGARLSGGERQRLCIARALLQHPTLLVFDEPTSQLDPDHERVVAGAIARATGERTVLVIAHRLSTVRAVDRIVLLSGGRVVEAGSHADLLARDGRYARLVRLGADDVEAVGARR